MAEKTLGKSWRKLRKLNYPDLDDEVKKKAK
jgi:hypothetical protein